MNAQQLIQETPVSHFDWKVFWKPKSSQINNLPPSDNKEGDKVVARKGNNQYPQAEAVGSSTSYPIDTPRPLMPQTFNYTKKQEALNNLEAQKVLKGLGIEVL